MTDESNPPLKTAAHKAHRVSKEFLATVIALVTTALGVVVALAWNSALSAFFLVVLKSPGAQVAALFTYAVLITAIGVTVIMSLTRLAARLDAEPVEFKYPAQGKDAKQP